MIHFVEPYFSSLLIMLKFNLVEIFLISFKLFWDNFLSNLLHGFNLKICFPDPSSSKSLQRPWAKNTFNKSQQIEEVKSIYLLIWFT